MSEKPYIYISDTPVYVTKKNVKNINLRVRPDRVNISAPMDLPNYKIVEVIEKNRGKISKQLKELKKRRGEPNNMDPSSVTSILFLGKKRPVIFTETNNLSYRNDKFYLPDFLKEKSYDYFEQCVDELIKVILKEKIQDQLDIWEAKTGLKCTGFQIRKMKTRWGSCTPQTGKMRFNFYLAIFNEKVIGSVVLHELIHLKEGNHQKGFYNLIYKFMPDYDRIQSPLKKVDSSIKYIY